MTKMSPITKPISTIPEALPIPGLRFRPYAGGADLPAMVDVASAAGAANGDTEHDTVDSMRVEFSNMTHVDPSQDVILAFIHDRLIAFSSIEWADSTDGERHYRSLGDVHPDWRRRGIGTAMMARNERRLAEIASGHEFAGPRKLMTWLHDLDHGGIALSRQRGYEQVRVYHHMVRPDMDGIDAPPLAAGLEVRPVSRQQLPQLWEAIAVAFRDHFGSYDVSPAAYRRWSEDPLMDPGLLMVAFDGEAMTAGVQGAIDPGENAAQGYLRGWTDPVFTRRSWRRRGLAYALLGRALQALKERGMTSAQLDVDSENANDALSLYRRHRFEVDRSSSEWHKSLTA